MRILFLLLFIIFNFTYSYAENISKIIVRIEIDNTKQGGHNWDTINIFGREPDPEGNIEIYSQKGRISRNINLQNQFTIEEMFNNVDLVPGDKISINLEDRDRGRWNDIICKGDIRWNGEPRMEVRHGYATIFLDFII